MGLAVGNSASLSAPLFYTNYCTDNIVPPEPCTSYRPSSSNMPSSEILEDSVPLT